MLSMFCQSNEDGVLAAHYTDINCSCIGKKLLKLSKPNWRHCKINTLWTTTVHAQ